MVERPPVQPTLKEGHYDQEQSSFGDLNIVLRNFATKKMRASLTSPPEAHMVGELEMVFDKATLRIYTKINGSLVYFQGT